jgi:hypothetical protein
MGPEPTEGRVRRGKHNVIDDDLDDDVIDDRLDGQGELRYKMLLARNRRKAEYAGAKMERAS